MLPHFLKEYKMINRWKCASYGSQRAWESGGGEGESGRAEERRAEEKGAA